MVVFNSLTKKELTKIVDIMLSDLNKRLKDMDISLEISEAAKERVIEEGSDFTFGARPLKRAIQKLIEDEVAERLLEVTFKASDTILIDAVNGKLTFKNKTEALVVK